MTEDYWDRFEREHEERIASNRAIIANKNLDIDEEQYLKAVQLAQMFADCCYREIPVWVVLVRKQVACVADNDEENLGRAAASHTTEIEIRGENRKFSIGEAEAIAQVLLQK